MLLRLSMGSKEENYEHVLMCLICRSLFDDYDHQPKFLPCHHTFCKDCLREYVQQMGDEIECPSCRKIANIPAAGVAALQTNFYVKYIQSLVHSGGSCCGGGDSLEECGNHPGRKLQYFCKDCNVGICDQCQEGGCSEHKKVSVTKITEEYHQKLDTAFSKANTVIELKKVQLEGMLKALCEEKDRALLKIDSTFEQHVHTLNRRATLLKNKVIDICNEHVSKLEADLEEISTAMTCIVSIKDYQENKISRGIFDEIERGIDDMADVFTNISDRVNPSENHILFEDKHGVDKFKISAKDLGRVQCKRPSVPRTAPEGNDSSELDRHRNVSTSSASPNDLGPGAVGTSWGYEDTDKSHAVDDSPFEEQNVSTSVSHVRKESASSAMSSSQSQLSKAPGCKVHCINSVDKDVNPKVTQRQVCECDRPILNGNVLINCSPDGAAEANSDTPSCSPSVTATEGDGAETKDLNANNTTLAESSPPTTTMSTGVMVSPPLPAMVVRPKTLEGVMRKKPQKASNIVKPVKGGQSPKTGIGGTGQNTVLAYNVYDIKPKSPTSLGPRLELHDDSASRDNLTYSLASQMANLKAVVKEDPRGGDSGKEAAKLYHQLVYTSYDEETLLKELKNEQQREEGMSQPANHRQSSMAASTDDDSSWMTVSSDGSTLSANSEEQSVL